MSMYQNPEMMQMHMLLGNNDTSSNMNILPYLLMQQGQNGNTNSLSPELIQTMMMSQMQMY